MHDLAIRNINILRDGVWTTTDFSIDDGKISGFDPASAKASCDAAGRYGLPGAVDLHVHFNEPGRTDWEGFASGSLAAAAGGVSFVVEMPLNSIPSTVTVEALQTKLEAIGAQSCIDFALWGGLVPGNIDDLVPLAEAGVAGFKAFMSPSGTDDFQNSDFDTLKAGMKEIAKTGKRLALHAEDPYVLDTVSEAIRIRESAYDWERSRPVSAELSAVRIALELSGETGCPIHIVHVSSPEVLELIAEGKHRGIDVSCETCPHYLLLTIEAANQIGPNAKCAPPLRGASTVEGMWNALWAGYLDTIGSDHSPCSPDLKVGKSFYDAWGGISGLQHGLPLLWDRVFEDPNLLQTVVNASSLIPSQLIKLPSKGSLEVGMDADFILAELLPEPETIREEALLYKHRHSAYCGLKSRISIQETWQRGRCVARGGALCSEPQGRFIRFPIGN